jgi:hypothetical protein
MAKPNPKKPIFDLRRKPSRYTPVDAGEPVRRSWLDIDEMKARYAAVAGAILFLMYIGGQIYWGLEIERVRREAQLERLRQHIVYYDLRQVMAAQRHDWKPRLDLPVNEEQYNEHVLDAAFAALRLSSAATPLQPGARYGMMRLFNPDAGSVAELVVMKEESQRARAAILKAIATQARRHRDPGYAWGMVSIMATGGCGGLDERRQAAGTYVLLYRAFQDYPPVVYEVERLLLAYPLGGKADAAVAETLRLAREANTDAATKYFLSRVTPPPAVQGR